MMKENDEFERVTHVFMRQVLWKLRNGKFEKCKILNTLSGEPDGGCFIIEWLTGARAGKIFATKKNEFFRKNTEDEYGHKRG